MTDSSATTTPRKYYVETDVRNFKLIIIANDDETLWPEAVAAAALNAAHEWNEGARKAPAAIP